MTREATHIMAARRRNNRGGPTSQYALQERASNDLPLLAFRQPKSNLNMVFVPGPSYLWRETDTQNTPLDSRRFGGTLLSYNFEMLLFPNEP